jgi:hypothetical protein
MPELKLYCKLHGLPVSGKKADLLERVSNHLAMAAAPKAEAAAHA